MGWIDLATTLSALTSADLKVLVRDDAAGDRVSAAENLCAVLAKTVLTPTERSQAQDILRFVAADASQLVRKALVKTLTNSPLVPRDGALRLLQDSDEIALPLLT
jgi:uncharacterized protein (DUF2336 family)